MATWYTAAQNIATGHIRHEIQYPLREVVRADGKFPYRPGIVSGPHLRISRGDQDFTHALACHRQVCPRPQRKYEAQIGLENMEKQAARAAPIPHNTMAKWGLEALASRAQSHFAHLRSPFVVANCALCRTSTVGRAVPDWVWTVASTPYTSPGSDVRSQMVDIMPRRSAQPLTGHCKQVFRDDPWASTARPPLLPDRDAVTTNSWHKACNISLGTSLEDEEGRDTLMAAW